MFARPNINIDEARAFLTQWARPLPEIDWVLSEEAFNAVLDKLVDSAPGPDGIPYSCWKRLPQHIRWHLFQAYIFWLNDSPLPADANWSFFSFDSKGNLP